MARNFKRKRLRAWIVPRALLVLAVLAVPAVVILMTSG